MSLRASLTATTSLGRHSSTVAAYLRTRAHTCCQTARMHHLDWRKNEVYLFIWATTVGSLLMMADFTARKYNMTALATTQIHADVNFATGLGKPRQHEGNSSKGMVTMDPTVQSVEMHNPACQAVLARTGWVPTLKRTMQLPCNAAAWMVFTDLATCSLSLGGVPIRHSRE